MAYLLAATLAGISGIFVSLPAQADAPPGIVARYDATRDAAADLERAGAAARSSGKRILVAVGGDWCKDCRELDRLFADNPALTALRDRRFVWVKVFVGSENRNEAALSRLPKIDWVPTLVVLDAGGRVQASVPSTEFHVEERLSATCVQAFLASR
jgi:thiol:disulfide interchange protein